MLIKRLNSNNEFDVVDINKIKNENISPQVLKKWITGYEGRNYAGYQHPKWPSNIWAREWDDIKSFLIKRFRTTEDESEYYQVMRLLYKTLPEKELFVQFSSIKGSNDKDAGRTKKDRAPVVTQSPKKKGKSRHSLGSETAKLQAKKSAEKADKYQKFELFE